MQVIRIQVLILKAEAVEPMKDGVQSKDEVPTEVEEPTKNEEPMKDEEQE